MARAPMSWQWAGVDNKANIFIREYWHNRIDWACIADRGRRMIDAAERLIGASPERGLND